MAVWCMRNASGHNYRNSSFIVDLAIWGRYHVPQNAFLVINTITVVITVVVVVVVVVVVSASLC